MSNNQPQTSQTSDNGNGKLWIIFLASIIVITLIIGFALAFAWSNFAFVPFSVVIMGIVAFFAVLKFTKTVSGSEDFAMRKAITVAIVVVYLGLLPTLAFQGILQFQVTGNTTTVVTNQTSTALPAIPQNISLSETVVSSFTALVAAVLLFYFGSRTLDTYFKHGGGGTTPESEDPTKLEKITTTVVTKEDNKETTIVTEQVVNVEDQNKPNV